MLPGDPSHSGGRGGTSRAEDGIVYIYIYTYIYIRMCIYIYICICICICICVCICIMYMYMYMCMCMCMCMCMYMYMYMYMYNRHLAQALACHFSASRCFAAAPSCGVLLAIAMDYLNVLIVTMSSLSNRLVQKFVPVFFAGLAAGWLLTTYSSIRIIPREVFLRLHVPGLAAGWLLPLCEKGEKFTLAIKLATFAYINNFLSHLSVCVTFFTDLAKVPSSRFRVSANCFAINLPKCTRYGCVYLF